MPQWLWILVGILVVIALVIFIMANVDVTVKESMIPVLSLLRGEGDDEGY